MHSSICYIRLIQIKFSAFRTGNKNIKSYTNHSTSCRNPSESQYYLRLIKPNISSYKLFDRKMYIRLKEKPYYFLTDRDTKYTFFVDNRQKKAVHHLYYPQQFETMTSNQIRSYKWKLVDQLMWWSLFNADKMTNTDKKICHSKITDAAFTVLMGMICASFIRRTLFRMPLPLFQLMTQNGVFSSRWLKSMTAYGVASIIVYNSINKIVKQQFLVDLALQYKYNFNQSLTSKECDGILNQLCEQRFSLQKIGP